MKDKIADVNSVGLDDWTPLHYACNNGYARIVNELLKQEGILISAVSTL